MARYRNCVFTINNPTGLPQFDEDKMEYLVYSEEMGAEEHNYHLQGYMELKLQTRIVAVQQLLCDTKCHLEPRFGTQAQAIDYCKKKDETYLDGPYEYGTPRKQGKRVELIDYKEAIQGGKRERHMYDEEFIHTSVKYPKLYPKIDSFIRPERDTPPEVILLIGETGLGKTRYVTDKWLKDEELWITPLSNGTIWFDTYDHHKVVLLDDFAGSASHMSLTAVLRLLDRLAIQIPTKGGHCWWHPDIIYVSTNIHPNEWYNWKSRTMQYDALARRFTKVLVFTKQGHNEAPADWWTENRPQALQPLGHDYTGVPGTGFQAHNGY